MAEKRNYWLKLKEDYFNSPKIKKLRKIAGGDTFTIIYLKMQLLSVRNDGIVQYEGIEPTFEEELALKLDEDLENVKVTLAYLQSQCLFETNDNEYLFLEANNNIGSEGQSAERKRKFDERKKALLCNGDVTDAKRISISSSISKSNSNKFIKPTLEEVLEYCNERNNNVNAEKFIDFYSSNGWKVGKNPMKDWKAAVRTWEKNDTNRSQKPKNIIQQQNEEYMKENGDWLSRVDERLF